MSDEARATMNLDLNLGPLIPASPSHEQGSDSGLVLGQPIGSDNWVEEQQTYSRRGSEAVRMRTRQRWRCQHVPLPPETRNISMESVQNLVDVNGPKTGEGSVPALEMPDEPIKASENNNCDSAEKRGKKCSGNEGSFFDCNICLDLSSEPVVTCCGHLFCWPCLFRWLDIHSDARECPVCKGEVSIKNVTPIYGRGTNSLRDPDVDSDFKIPIRPQARRVESFRQSIVRNSFSYPMEEMVRRLGNRFDLARDLVSSLQDPNNNVVERHQQAREIIRRENLISENLNVVDLSRSNNSNIRRLHQRVIPVSNSPLEPVIEASVGGNEWQAPGVEDRDSISSIGAVIQSGSQTVDTAVEIDSTLSLSTSSSRRRRSSISRVSDVNSGESKRRRLN